MPKAKYLDIVVNWISKRSPSTVMGNFDGYDPPKMYKNSETGEEIKADFSFVVQGGATSFIDIALKSDSPRNLVTRWKLLSVMAAMKQGKLHLFAPKGHKMFTQNLINKYHINAVIHPLNS